MSFRDFMGTPCDFAGLDQECCGYKLANDGVDTRAIQDWLGHVSITHTTRSTALSPARFKDFWRD
jgi:type 1 fimbriae regulatory protein FimB/type 1 fimbriae regulatory protein FimE